MHRKIPFECVTLLLQGGGALGAYQAGVYQALSETGLEPDWVGGVSIGAINAAIIAGNKPQDRLDKLREFWTAITVDQFRYPVTALEPWMKLGPAQYQIMDLASALRTLLVGVPDFFQPRPLTPWLHIKGTLAATSFYDNAPLKPMLERLIDFDRLNNSDMRFTIAAVNVTEGNYREFDNKKITITPEHIMASGALPPGLPPVEIDGEYYWDGGMISNTPLYWVVENKLEKDMLIFQVDLWSSYGEFPQNMADVFTRMKDINYSSRSRINTQRFKEKRKLSALIAELLDSLPEDKKRLKAARELREYASNKIYNIVHLIYRNKCYEGYSKDFEFSRLSMEAHWKSGYEDTLHTLKHPEVLQHPQGDDGVSVFDFSKELLKEAA